MAGVMTSKLATALTFSDAAGTPVTCALVDLSLGDFTLEGMEAGRSAGSVNYPEEALEVIIRGKLYEYVAGDDKEMTGQFTVIHEGELSTGSNRAFDVTSKLGAFAAGTTQDAGGVVWSTDLVVTWVRSAVTVTLTLYSCRVSLSYAESKEGNRMVLSWRTRMGYSIA